MKEIEFYKSHINNKEHEYIKEALVRGDTYILDKFEDELKKYFGVKYAITTNNGTAAKHLSLCAMDLKRGDKIICSVNSFPDIPEVIRHFDAEPIFVDINEDDFNINPEELERVLKTQNHKKLKAAFITHVGGQPAQMDEIYDIANRYDIKIIDDASRALGAKYNGKLIGSNPNSFISCFQINAKIQYAVATAGIMLTNDEKINERAKLIRSHALVRDSLDNLGNLGYIYDIVDIGQKYDLNTICAAYALAQFEKTEMFNEKTAHIASIYDKELKDCPHIQIPVKKRDRIYNHYIIKIDKNRDDFARKLKEKGIQTGLNYVSIHLLSYYKNKYTLRVNDFPNALKIYQQVLSLPIYSSLSDEDVYYICDCIKSIAKNRV